MKVLQHAATVSLLTALSRVLGLLREILMASVFGTSLVKSAFDIAFRIPNLFRSIFGEGALSAAFVPVYNETRAQSGVTAANQLAGQVLSMLAALLSAFVALGMIGIAILRPFLLPDGRTDTALRLLAILFPYLVFLCLAAVCMGILNSINRYAISAAAPTLMNLVWIGTLAVIIPFVQDSLQRRITIIAWAVVASGALQLLAQAIPIWKNPETRPAWPRSATSRPLQKILTLFFPAALATGVRDINAIIDNVLAFSIGVWAPATLVFAERLVFLPLSLFATAFGTVLLPTLSRQAAQDPAAMRQTLEQSISAMLIFMIPAAAGLMLLATPLTRLIYEAGAFDSQSTLLTARALIAYAPGLVVFSFYKMIVPAFYALQDTHTPKRWAIRAVFLNLALNLLFIAILPTYWKHSGLALATVLASLFNTIALSTHLHRTPQHPDWRLLGTRTLRISFCACGMAACLTLWSHLCTNRNWLPQTTKPAQTLYVLTSIAIGLTSYTILLLLFCRKDLTTIFKHNQK